MTTPQRFLCLSSLISVTALLSSCSEADYDHFYGLDAQPGYKGPSTYYSQSPQGRPTQYQAPATDSFYTQQNAAREANLRAGRELQYNQQMQSYKDGYRSTLPNY